MIQTLPFDPPVAYTMTTTNDLLNTVVYVYYFGEISLGRFGMWTKEMDDLLYDQQAFGL